MKKETRKINAGDEVRKGYHMTFRGVETVNDIVIEWQHPEPTEEWDEENPDRWEVQFMNAFTINGHRFEASEYGEHIVGPNGKVFQLANYGWAHDKENDVWKVIDAVNFEEYGTYGDPIDTIFSVLEDADGFNFYPCALCGKLGEVVLVETSGGWHNLEVRCPDACDEGGFGEDNILFGSQNFNDVRDWAYETRLDFDSIRRV
jgi:hypothetical protein